MDYTISVARITWGEADYIERKFPAASVDWGSRSTEIVCTREDRDDIIGYLDQEGYDWEEM